MNKEVLAKWKERGEPEGLHKLAFLKGIAEYKEALRAKILEIDTYATNEVLMKKRILFLLEEVEPLPLPDVEKQDEGYF